MVKIPTEVLEGLEACRSSGDLNMFDRHGVIMWLRIHWYHEAANWVDDNKMAYVQGIFEGFENE